MKKASALMASVAAASSVALPVDRQEPVPRSRPADAGKESPKGKGKGRMTGKKAAEEQGRFAPRFDGLRFIETLVTAHR